jgi:hypothetical protein
VGGRKGAAVVALTVSLAKKQACLTSLPLQTRQARTEKPFQRLLSAPKRYTRTHRTSEGTAERVGGERNGRHRVHGWPGPSMGLRRAVFSFCVRPKTETTDSPYVRRRKARLCR